MEKEPEDEARGFEGYVNRAWAQLRHSLLNGQGAETIESLAARRGEDVETTRSWVEAAWGRRELLTVSVGGEVRIPFVQLTADGQLDETISWYARQLVEVGYDGWSAWKWLALPTEWLSDDVLSEVALSNPRRAKHALRNIVDERRAQDLGYFGFT